MPTLLAINGSPAATSKTAALLDALTGQLAEDGWSTSTLRLRDLPTRNLLHADAHDPAVQNALALVAQADAVVVASPVYKAAYTGLLKTFIDLLPPKALQEKSVLPLMTGGTIAHLSAIDYTLRPLLVTLGGTNGLQGIFALDTEFDVQGQPSTEVVGRIQAARITLNRRHLVPAEILD
jgi:FMN reductase